MPETLYGSVLGALAKGHEHTRPPADEPALLGRIVPLCLTPRITNGSGGGFHVGYTRSCVRRVLAVA